MSRCTETVLTRRIGGGTTARRPELVLVEEPLEIRLDRTLVATTMRTPGHDFELAAGWCHSEGLLIDTDGEAVPVTGIRYCATGSAVDTAFNTATVQTGGRSVTPRRRLSTATSSCGICGRDAVEELTARLSALERTGPYRADVLLGLGDRVAEHQELFDLTGGSHAAAACTPTGEVLVAREDIGRHNAVDKVVGRMLLDGLLPATGEILWVSGRASFEIAQKAWAAGFGALVSVSAPSSLAVATARAAGMVLAGFGRDRRLTIYTGEDLVLAEDD